MMQLKSILILLIMTLPMSLIHANDSCADAAPTQQKPQIFSSSDTANLNKSLNIPATIIAFNHGEKTGDHHVAFLKKMGVKRNQDNALEANPEEMLQKVEEERLSLIDRKILNENETLQACRIYKKPNGELDLIPFGETIPEGYVEASNHVIPDLVFWKFIADGKFPVGNLQIPLTFSSVNIFHPFLHDFVHLSAFYANPKFMKAFREAGRRIIADNTGKMGQRFFFVAELLRTLDDQSSHAINEFLISSRLNTTGEPMLKSQYFETLNTLESSRLIGLATVFMNIKPKYLFWGGVSNDSLVRNAFHNDKVIEMILTSGTSAQSFYQLAEKALERISNGINPEENLVVLKDSMSSILEYVDHLKDQQPDQIAMDVINRNEESLFWKLFCKGVMKGLDTTIQKMCRN